LPSFLPSREEKKVGLGAKPSKVHGKMIMEKLIIHIEASKDYYDGYAVNVDGIYGAGSSVEECKADVGRGLRLMIESAAARGDRSLPEWLMTGNYVIEYTYDLPRIVSRPSSRRREKVTGYV